MLAEQQRDEALSHVKALKEKLEQVNISSNSTANIRASDLRGLPLTKLKNIQVSFFRVHIASSCYNPFVLIPTQTGKIAR